MTATQRQSFCELEYTKQRKVFEEDILPTPQNDLFLCQPRPRWIKLVLSIYSGNTELLEGLSELKPFYFQYFHEDRNIEYLNKKMSYH